MIIENVAFPAGRHCETTTLGALLRHEGVELSEPMLFGLGEGLGFVYWDARNMDFPFLGGRTKPTTITRTVADRLGLTLHVQETASPRKAWQNVAAAVAAGRPVGLQLDCYHLDYFTTKVHFGGHFVAMYGYDDTHAYLVDTAQQGGAVTTTLTSLERARNERGPMTARNLSYTVARPTDRPDLGDAIRTAVRDNAHAFLNPPIANLGHRGIDKAARQVTRWLDRANDPSRDLPQTAALMERGGTGGALFRAMYRDFLAECATIVDDDDVRLGHQMYAEIAPLWTEVSQHITAAGETGDPDRLTRASAILTELADRERAAMRVLSGVRAD
ncbi:lantibiotic ABC transporter [Micromonospora echinospora]|uniref:Butirosin biosynthesis protein H, N-terminal n=1 Tax=Micromonospora echinospora TaxID=1877 RepID=A0A1C4Z0W3_MICEC|nr:BtrH N-terminal domain-containing protein [Micromonospora echinospora]OZV77461.1 lantibiotic ABC transporter [Micromonospora echinospora]SCF26615.1 Butirosin biosynthesis protein H, N-terminal [Micromonospora echinospora]